MRVGGSRLELTIKEEKTPSKMDVALWDKHWIQRELDGFGLYSMVFVEIQWYSMVFVDIQWYSMVFVEI